MMIEYVFYGKKAKNTCSLAGQKLCIISTVDKNNKPESALIGFAELPDLSLVFGTDKTSRKYINILDNKFVAFSFNSITEKERITIQYEGTIQKLEDNELDEYKKIFFLKNPGAGHYDSVPNQVFLKVIPTWLRYSNYTFDPNEIFEITI